MEELELALGLTSNGVVLFLIIFFASYIFMSMIAKWILNNDSFSEMKKRAYFYLATATDFGVLVGIYFLLHHLKI